MIHNPHSQSEKMIRKPALNLWSESKDSRTRLEALIWIKRFTNPHRTSDLNKIICEPAPKFWSKLNDSQSTLPIWKNDSQTRLEALIWIKRFTNPHRTSDLNKIICEPAPKFWSKSNDSQYVLLRPDLNLRWIILFLIQSFKKLSFTHH